MEFNVLETKKLSNEELKQIYDRNLPADFPKNEIRPWWSFQQCIEKGIYFGYGLYGEKLLSYALFVAPETGSSVLLDFYAVDSLLRGKGIGQSFLAEIARRSKEYDGIILEVEDPDKAKDDAELSIRKRRIAFYQRCGAYVTGVATKVLGVNFRVMYLPVKGKIDEDTLVSELGNIYCNLLPDHEETGSVKIDRIR